MVLENFFKKEKRNKISKFLLNFGYYSRPSFLIVGAQKAGTSALFQYLSTHPQVYPPKTKEIGYFSNDSIINLRDHYYYHIQFPFPHQKKRDQITFEATPEYLYHPECAQRIEDYDSNIKIIILLREPVSRAFSAWTMYHNFFKSKNHYNLVDTRSFENAIQNELNNIDSVNWYRDSFAYLRRGIYFDQVKKYIDLFPKNQIKIIESNDYKKNIDNTHKDILNFLGLNSKVKLEAKNRNERVYNEKLSLETKELLKTFYKPYNEKLFNLLGVDFGWNNN